MVDSSLAMSVSVDFYLAAGWGLFLSLEAIRKPRELKPVVSGSSFLLATSVDINCWEAISASVLNCARVAATR
jgi:hypothetical protein